MIGDGRPRLMVVDQVAVTTSLDPYLSLKALAAYSGCSTRWLRDRLIDPAHPLPCYRLPVEKDDDDASDDADDQTGREAPATHTRPRGGKILVRRSEFDRWIMGYRRVGHPDVERIVSETLRAVRSSRDVFP